jgi:anaerobic ribonucleoside-triphosphate reductase
MKEGETMEAEKGDGCMCPRCNDRIPEEFYCRTCGYLPDWRQMASEKYEAHREAA